MGCVYSDYLTFVKISIVDISDYLYIRKSAIFVIYTTYPSLLFSLCKIDAQCYVRLRGGTCKWSQESAEKVLTSRNNVCNVNSQFPPPNIADKFNPLLYLLPIHFAGFLLISYQAQNRIKIKARNKAKTIAKINQA